MLVPLASIDAVAALPRKLDADAEYAKAGEAFLKASPKEPGYINLEVRIMLAADFMPKLELPEKKDTRVFELRRYRNPSEPAFRKKLEMFGKGGELAIFRRVGLHPVFYGEMLAGPDMPNITYMLTYPEAAAKGGGMESLRRRPRVAQAQAPRPDTPIPRSSPISRASCSSRRGTRRFSPFSAGWLGA